MKSPCMIMHNFAMIMALQNHVWICMIMPDHARLCITNYGPKKKISPGQDRTGDLWVINQEFYPAATAAIGNHVETVLLEHRIQT